MIDDPIAVKVDETDIQNGLRNQGDRCALTLAFKRKYPEARNVHITREQVRFTKDRTVVHRPLTQEAKEFIDAFDFLPRDNTKAVSGEITITTERPVYQYTPPAVGGIALTE